MKKLILLFACVLSIGAGKGFIEDKALGIRISQNYPNPCNNATTILIDAREAKKEIELVVRIYDIRGRLVREQKLGGFTGVNTVAVDIKGLGTGTYFCEMIGNNQRLGVMRMLILK